MEKRYVLSEPTARFIQRLRRQEEGNDLNALTNRRTGSTLSPVTVVATAAAAGRGKYTGKIVLPPTGDVSASGAVAAADFGSSTDGATVLILNSMEVGSTATLTHPLRLNKPYIGRLLRINSDGTPVVGVTVLEGDLCEEGV